MQKIENANENNLPPSQRNIPCVLVVEDDDDLREMLAEEIVRYGYNAKMAAHGEIALQLLAADVNDFSKNRQIDAVLCDIKMPVMNGYKLFEELKKLKFNRPFIFMTADPSENVNEWAKSNGVFHFLEKPFDFDILNELILRAGKIGFDQNNNYLEKRH